MVVFVHILALYSYFNFRNRMKMYTQCVMCTETLAHNVMKVKMKYIFFLLKSIKTVFFLNVTKYKNQIYNMFTMLKHSDKTNKQTIK